MKKLSLFLLCIIMLLSGCQTNKEKDSTVVDLSLLDKNTIEDLDKVVLANNFKGIACIYYDGIKCYESDTGYANESQNLENDSKQIYRIGSLSKQFTAAGICILCEDKKMNLEDTLDLYFDDYQNGNKITIKNLLNMCSGIPDYIGNRTNNNGVYKEKNIDFEISNNKTAVENQKEIQKWILSQTLEFEPGATFEYSNSNYFLLARIIEIVSGQNYCDYIENEVIKKAGLTSTGFDESTITTVGHIYDSTMTEKDMMETLDIEWLYYPGVLLGCVDMVSSVDDLFIWLTYLKSGELVGQEMIDKFFEKNDYHFGFGFITTDDSVAMSGFINCYTSYMQMDDRFTVIALSNYYSDDFPIVKTGTGINKILSKEFGK